MTEFLAKPVPLNLDRATHQAIVVSAHAEARATGPHAPVEFDPPNEIFGTKRRRRRNDHLVRDAFCRRLKKIKSFFPNASRREQMVVLRRFKRAGLLPCGDRFPALSQCQQKKIRSLIPPPTPDHHRTAHAVAIGASVVGAAIVVGVCAWALGGVVGLLGVPGAGLFLAVTATALGARLLFPWINQYQPGLVHRLAQRELDNGQGMNPYQQYDRALSDAEAIDRVDQLLEDPALISDFDPDLPSEKFYDLALQLHTWRALHALWPTTDRADLVSRGTTDFEVQRTYETRLAASGDPQQALVEALVDAPIRAPWTEPHYRFQATQTIFKFLLARQRTGDGWSETDWVRNPLFVDELQTFKLSTDENMVDRAFYRMVYRFFKEDRRPLFRLAAIAVAAMPIRERLRMLDLTKETGDPFIPPASNPGWVSERAPQLQALVDPEARLRSLAALSQDLHAQVRLTWSKPWPRGGRYSEQAKITRRLRAAESAGLLVQGYETIAHAMVENLRPEEEASLPPELRRLANAAQRFIDVREPQHWDLLDEALNNAWIDYNQRTAHFVQAMERVNQCLGSGTL